MPTDRPFVPYHNDSEEDLFDAYYDTSFDDIEDFDDEIELDEYVYIPSAPYYNYDDEEGSDEGTYYDEDDFVWD